MPDRPVTEVAVAVVIDPQRGKFLLGSRPEGKPYAGYWEFPGGKLEKGESVHEALVRELREELDLTITDSVPWFVMEHDYPHAYVRLHFRRSWAFSGTPKALENQTFCWCTAEDTGTLAAMKLLPMDALVISRIALPAVLAVPESSAGLTKAADFVRHTKGAAFLAEDDTALQFAAEKGLPVVDLRETGCWAATDAEADEAAADGVTYALCVNRLPLYVEGSPETLTESLRAGAHGVYCRF